MGKGDDWGEHILELCRDEVKLELAVLCSALIQLPTGSEIA